MPDCDEIKSYVTDSVSISPWVSSHIFEDQLLIFSEQSQTIFTLNPSAAFIWLSCEKRMSLADIASEMSAAFNVSFTTVESDLKAIITQWASLKLVATPTDINDSPVTFDKLESSESGSVMVGQRFEMECSNKNSLGIYLAGSNFILRFSHPQIEDLVRPVFNHLECSLAEPPKVCDVVRVNGQILIVIDGFILDVFSSFSEIVPRLTFVMLDSAYRNIDFLIAIHAAALSVGNNCLLFPGDSGVGKSTLSAALIKSGFKYLTEDTAIIDINSRRVIAAPVSLRIKEGSWSIVQAMFQDSLTTTVHNSRDGRKIRYLVPPEESFHQSNMGCDFVKALVFPKYSPESETSIRAISRIDTILKIQDCGYDAGARLNKAKVAELLDWIKDVDCYEMNYTSSPEAVSIVRSLLA